MLERAPAQLLEHRPHIGQQGEPAVGVGAGLDGHVDALVAGQAHVRRHDEGAGDAVELEAQEHGR